MNVSDLAAAEEEQQRLIQRGHWEYTPDSTMDSAIETISRDQFVSISVKNEVDCGSYPAALVAHTIHLPRPQAEALRDFLNEVLK